MNAAYCQPGAKAQPRSRIAVFASGGLPIVLSGCLRFAEPCPEVTFDEGDRIQVTVEGRLDPTVPSCGVLDLEPGASFELIGGPLLEEPISMCSVRTTLPIPPPQFAPVMTYCEMPTWGIGMRLCDVLVSPTCKGRGGGGMVLIDPVVLTTENEESATLVVGWSEWSDDCAGRPSCGDRYRVTVRLVEE